MFYFIVFAIFFIFGDLKVSAMQSSKSQEHTSLLLKTKNYETQDDDNIDEDKNYDIEILDVFKKYPDETDVYSGEDDATDYVVGEDEDFKILDFLGDGVFHITKYLEQMELQNNNGEYNQKVNKEKKYPDYDEFDGKDEAEITTDLKVYKNGSYDLNFDLYFGYRFQKFKADYDKLLNQKNVKIDFFKNEKDYNNNKVAFSKKIQILKKVANSGAHPNILVYRFCLNVDELESLMNDGRIYFKIKIDFADEKSNVYGKFIELNYEKLKKAILEGMKLALEGLYSNKKLHSLALEDLYYSKELNSEDSNSNSNNEENNKENNGKKSCFDKLKDCFNSLKKEIEKTFNIEELGLLDKYRFETKRTTSGILCAKKSSKVVANVRSILKTKAKLSRVVN